MIAERLTYHFSAEVMLYVDGRIIKTANKFVFLQSIGFYIVIQFTCLFAIYILIYLFSCD